MAPMAAPKQTLYDILGVAPDATSIDIGLAYEQAIAAADRAAPPDPTRQALIRQAHEVLSNASRRAAYDSSLVTATEKQAARAQAAAPDLDLAAEEEAVPRRRGLPWIPIGAAVVVVLVGAVLTLRQPPPAETKTAAVAPKPTASTAPAAPKPKSAAEILASALPSVGQVVTYDMSGRMTATGLALAVEPAAMVTTCDGVQAGSQITVKVGAESLSATLAITDETLGLCRLLVPGAAFDPFTFSSEEARAGSAIHVLGANEKGDMALTQGTIKRVRDTPSGPVLELSMPIARAGNGGPVFDDFGRVIAIASRHDGGPSSALPASSLADLRSRSR